MSKQAKYLYGLIGKSLSHSFSKRYFAEKFLVNNWKDYQYLNFEIEHISDIYKLIKKHPDLLGFNVTIPYKEEIIPLLDICSEDVKAIGACNTVRIDRTRDKLVLYGFNTDQYGFAQSLKKQLDQRDKHALVLGSGGASKAVCYALEKMGITYRIVSRSKDKKLHYEELDESIMHDHQIIINTTPLGTFPDVLGKPAIPYSALHTHHYLYDLVYNPAETAFLKEGLARGCRIQNGLEMLHLQAEKAWGIWKS